MDAIFNFDKKYDVSTNSDLENLARIKVINISGGGGSGSGIPEIIAHETVEFVSSQVVYEPVQLIGSSDATTNGTVTFSAVAGHTYWVCGMSCAGTSYTRYPTTISYDSSKCELLYDYNMSETYGGKACILKCNENDTVSISAQQHSWWYGVIKMAYDITGINIDTDNITKTFGGDNTTRVYFNTVPAGETYLFFAMATGRQRGYSGVSDVSTSDLLYYNHVPNYDTNESCTMVETTANGGNIYTNTYDGSMAVIFTIPTL